MIYDRYVSLGDLHLLASNPVCRLDDLTTTQWTKLRFVFEYAEKKQAAILLAGDLGDVSNNYTLLNKFAALLKEFQEKGVVVFAVFGQHDLKYRNEEDTNMDILISAGLITKLSRNPISLVIAESAEDGVDFHYRIYGASWGDDFPTPDSSGAENILVIHAPISPVSLFQGHHYMDTRDFAKDHHEFSMVICGDVHRTFMEKEGSTLFLNSGPMVRKEADEYNLIHKPGFYFIDFRKKDVKYVEIPHQPSDKVITRQHIDRKKRKTETAARADAAQFIHELSERTQKKEQSTLDLRERLIQRSTDPKGKISKGAKAVIELLLNTGEVKTYGGE